MRLGEIGGLFWSDLDLERRAARIQRSLVTGYVQTFEPPKTPNSHRTVVLTEAAKRALVGHRERQGAQGFPADGDALVFTNTVGRPINPSHLLCRSFKPLLRRNGLPETTFQAATRHTCCCILLAAGLTPGWSASNSATLPWPSPSSDTPATCRGGETMALWTWPSHREDHRTHSPGAGDSLAPAPTLGTLGATAC
jgi:integrase